VKGAFIGFLPITRALAKTSAGELASAQLARAWCDGSSETPQGEGGSVLPAPNELGFIWLDMETTVPGPHPYLPCATYVVELGGGRAPTVVRKSTPAGKAGTP
jgi:hypothetical protein